MNDIFITAASQVTEADVRAASLGTRFGRMDLASQLALVAVESLGIDFTAQPRERIGIFLGARAGSLAADLEFWRGRDATGGPSPTLFTYTLPSAPIGEIAIRHQLTGPNLCLIGGNLVLAEAANWVQRGEVDACLCVEYNVFTPVLGQMLQTPPVAREPLLIPSPPLGERVRVRGREQCQVASASRACALFLRRGGNGLRLLGENDRDLESLCAALCAKNLAG